MANDQPSQPKTDPAVDAELEQLPTMPIVQLRKRYVELFRKPPPKAFGPDLLRRSIAYRIQEVAYGGLSRPVQKMLDQMIKAYWKNPKGRIELPRRIKPGSVLARDWKGTTHQVTVLEEGYSYAGRSYASLSEIAGLITGTKWNGPKFFGLRPKADKSAKPALAGKSGRSSERPEAR